MQTESNETLDAGDELYEQFGRPLEADHYGEFVAIARDGKFVLGKDIYAVASEANHVLGGGVYLFKIGPKVIGNWL